MDELSMLAPILKAIPSHAGTTSMTRAEPHESDRSLFASACSCLTDIEARYWIPQYVHACATPQGGVVLDLRRDKYFGISRNHMQALATVVQGWPHLVSPEASHHETSIVETLETAETLADHEVLTRKPTEVRDVTSPRSPVGCTMLDVSVDIDCDYEVRPHHIFNYVRSVASGVWLLRHHPLESTARMVADRRASAVALGRAEWNVLEIARLIKIFKQLKSFGYSGRGKCMLDSLVLLDFLSHYRIFPYWVIGVTTAPFTAHSWLEAENFVIGGTPEETAYAYTPIMMV